MLRVNVNVGDGFGGPSVNVEAEVESAEDAVVLANTILGGVDLAGLQVEDEFGGCDDEEGADHEARDEED